MGLFWRVRKESDFILIRFLSVIYLQEFYTNHSLMIVMRREWNVIIRTEQVPSPFEACSVLTDWNKLLKQTVQVPNWKPLTYKFG